MQLEAGHVSTVDSDNIRLTSSMGAERDRVFTHAQLTYSRTVSAALALFFSALLWYTIDKDGSPFRSELLTPWMNTTLVDFYLNCAVLLLWIWHREASSLRALAWSAFLCCLGSAATWLYVAYVLMQLRPGDKVSKFWTGR